MDFLDEVALTATGEENGVLSVWCAAAAPPPQQPLLCCLCRGATRSHAHCFCDGVRACGVAAKA